MYLSNRDTDASHLPNDVVCMKDAKQQSLVMCMPQDRNIHNNIFGERTLPKLSYLYPLSMIPLGRGLPHAVGL